MPPFRDDQILIIAPGSETTLAQLGLPESFTPARYRLRSRMFPAEKEGEYEPVRIRRKEKPATAPTAPVGGLANPEQTQPGTDDEPEWEEDPTSNEGAVWPIQGGKIVDWACFFALMSHVYNTVNPPFHTPIMLIAEPVWTTKEHEKVTQFFFEKFKVPAFTMVDSAMAASYAYGITTATVVDIGLEKTDITCIVDSQLYEVSRSTAVPDCGGEVMTTRLMELLGSRKGFTREVCEQLKKSNICEVLPSDLEADSSGNPAAAASTGAGGAGAGQRKPSAVGDLPRGPGPDTQVGDEREIEDDQGVLDIASIVTGGNMTEYLAQKEREKAERQAVKQQKKGGDAHLQNAAKPVRLPNHKRTRATFVYEDVALHDAMKKAGMSSQSMVDMQSAMDDGPNKRQKTPEPQSAVSDKPADSGLPVPQQQRQPDGATTTDTGGIKREIEVGPERFQAATGTESKSGLLDRIADAIHRTVQACPDQHRRSELWDALIIVGNGGKVRGFREAVLETLQRKYLISPSSATIFTSELPSNLSTPLATGTNTPQPSQQLHSGPHGPGVNPLLLAATTAQNPALQPPPPPPPHPMSGAGPLASLSSSHTSHAQTPTSIKLAKIPDYFPEWKEVGYDEATFLGAQVAAKVLFVVDTGAGSKAYMSRSDYNEQGPGYIHEVYL